MLVRLSVFILFCLTAVHARASIIVPDDYGTIAEGIAAASEGDTVLVRAGTYSGSGNVNLDFDGTNLVLAGLDGAAVTVVDCSDTARAFCFHSGEGPTSVIRGFTVANGYSDEGGAIWCSGASPTIEDCSFESNTGFVGGALWIADSEASIVSCVFTGNTALTHGGYLYGGGAMWCYRSSPIIIGCQFESNTGGCGGGVYLTTDSHPQIDRCSFVSNSATAYGGGAVFCYVGSSPVIAQSSFITNSAVYRGGAVLTVGSNPRITECTFEGNVALTDYLSYGGGAICVDGGSPGIHYCEFTSNEAVRGGGVQCIDAASPWIRGCTFLQNSAARGAGLYCREGSSPEVEDSHFEAGVSVSGAGVFSHSSSPQLRRCVFLANLATGLELVQGGGAVFVFAGEPDIAGSTFAENTALHGGAVLLSDVVSGSIARSTIVDCSGSSGAAFFLASSGMTLTNSIVSDCIGPSVGSAGPALASVSCSDLWGNTGGDWIGPFAGQLGVSGNISADPLLCRSLDPEAPYSLHDDSPCTEENNAECGQLGAWDVGCAASTHVGEEPVDTSWGALKSLFR